MNSQPIFKETAFQKKQRETDLKKQLQAKAALQVLRKKPRSFSQSLGFDKYLEKVAKQNG